ncbi:MAG TPA: Gldg family protein [Bacteroidota bacterium]|jgi:gliding-associated putative ABC transporter substrate-binding component GldG|nr:Gldg family protein [Bacteroidota bacterium]
MNQRTMLLRLLLVVAAIVLLNLLAVRFFSRLDLTHGKMYTLSPVSKGLMENLDDKFTVKAYFTSDLPAPYNNNRRYLQDQLDDYRAYSHGNFRYEFVDPSKKEDLKQEAQKYGIPPVQVQVVKEDKLQIQEAYMGLVMLYGDKQERLPVVRPESNLEYEISSAVKKMTAKELKKIGFLTGQGEPALTQFGKVQEILTKQYQVTTVDLTGGKPVPQDIAVLMIVAPDKPFRSWEKFLIDQYIMKGGRVAFLLNKVAASLQNQMGRPLTLDLDDMLEAYGVRVNADLVRDASCAMVTMQQPFGSMMIQTAVPFYYLPKAIDFDKSSPVVKDLSGVVFYFASSIDTSLSRSKGLTTQVLVQSTKHSGRQENYFYFDPRMQATPEQFKESGIPLAATVEGVFVSAFANKPVGVDSSVRAAIDTTNKQVSGKVSKIAVIGDGDFPQDQLSGGNRDNFLLASNIVDYLADDIGLASIRSRDSDVKPLDEVSENTRAWVKGINLAAPPLLVLLVGMVRWRWRATQRKQLETRVL